MNVTVPESGETMTSRAKPNPFARPDEDPQSYYDRMGSCPSEDLARLEVGRSAPLNPWEERYLTLISDICTIAFLITTEERDIDSDPKERRWQHMMAHFFLDRDQSNAASLSDLQPKPPNSVLLSQCLDPLVGSDQYGVLPFRALLNEVRILREVTDNWPTKSLDEAREEILDASQPKEVALQRTTSWLDYLCDREVNIHQLGLNLPFEYSTSPEDSDYLPLKTYIDHYLHDIIQLLYIIPETTFNRFVDRFESFGSLQQAFYSLTEATAQEKERFNNRLNTIIELNDQYKIDSISQEVFPKIVDAARERLSLSMGRALIELASRYFNESVPFYARVQEGYIAIMEAVPRYDPKRGYTFGTYVLRCAEYAMISALNGRSGEIKRYILEKAGRVRYACQKFKDKYDYEPTPEELVLETGLFLAPRMQDDRHMAEKIKSIKDEGGKLSSRQQRRLDMAVDYVRAIMAMDTLRSLDEPVRNEQGSDSTLGDVVSDPSDPLRPVEAQVLTRLWLERRIAGLTPVQLEVVFWYLDGYTFEGIGDKRRTTKQAAQQAWERALDTLREE